MISQVKDILWLRSAYWKETKDGAGVAICSRSEKEFNRKVGRKLAYNRAFKALMSKKTSMLISLERGFFRDRSGVGNFRYLFDSNKSTYNCATTSFEAKLIEKATGGHKND